jgi:RNA polymerase sigma factor (sigma-70 family)
MGEGPYTPADALAEDSDLEGAQLETYRARIRVFAARRLHDWTAAEDIAQETLTRGLAALRAGQIRNRDALGGYLFQTALRLCLHRGRSAGRERKALLRFGSSAPDASEANPLSELISAEERKKLLAALGEVSAEDRTLLELTCKDELDAAEIGRRLGATPGAICVRRHRALRRLAKILGVRKGTDRDLDG